MTGYLRVAVFLAGFGVLGAEMVAPRLFAPAFGASQLVWTQVIGTILATLTLGSWLGGRLADRRPSEQVFGWLLLAGGIGIATVPLAARPVLATAMQALAEQRAGSYLASLAAASLLFAPPVLVLATLTPYAIRLAAWGHPDLGAVAGSLSALAALGSIAGTFLTSIVLLPQLGSRNTLLASGALLACAGAVRALGLRTAPLLAIALIALGWSYQAPLRSDPRQVFESESLYSYIQVHRDADGSMRLLTNESLGYQSAWPGKGLLTHGVWDYLALTPALVERSGPELRVLIVGLAAGTIARQIHLAYSPSSRVTLHGIELDPVVIDLGRRYFSLDSVAGLTIQLGDARVAIESLEDHFDVIVVDVVRGLYLPSHLVTAEFFDACRRRLAGGGVLAMNAAIPLGSGRLLGALVTTVGKVFEEVRVMQLPPSGPIANTLLFASRRALAPPPAERIPQPLRSLALDLRPLDVPQPHRRVLTDDHAPIEWLTDVEMVEALQDP